jgi:multidrug efflux system membrane fusion protein
MKDKQPLEVQALDRTQQKIIAKGKLLTTDNLIDTTTGTVKMRAGFDNKDTSLFPNQFVNTRLLVNTLRDVVLLPSSAIQHNGTQAFVWIVQNGVANMRNVTTGVSDDNNTQVTGINAGDVVANGSFEKLQPGSKIVPPTAGPGGQKGAAGSKGAAAGSGAAGTAGSTAP